MLQLSIIIIILQTTRIALAQSFIHSRMCASHHKKNSEQDLMEFIVYQKRQTIIKIKNCNKHNNRKCTVQNVQ